jgi:nickel-dependent lactate racemase
MEIGHLANGLPVHFNKIAYHADGIVVVNRIKVHTAFKSEIESGLHKMFL